MLVTSDVFQFAIGPKMLFVHSPCTGDEARHFEIAYVKSSLTVEVEPRPEVCPLMLTLSAKVALLQTGSVRTPKEHEYPLYSFPFARIYPVLHVGLHDCPDGKPLET